VIAEAMSPADLHTHLDYSTLLRLWSYIWLAPPVRHAWEQKFPELANLRRPAEVDLRDLALVLVRLATDTGRRTSLEDVLQAFEHSRESLAAVSEED
jgi:hypothetical protein